jgi:hypothetical protein
LSIVRGRNKKIEDFLDLVLIVNGFLCTFIGASGILIITFSVMKMDDVLLSAFAFVSGYMITIGVFLLVFHKKIIVRPKRHFYYDSRYFG